MMDGHVQGLKELAHSHVPCGWLQFAAIYTLAVEICVGYCPLSRGLPTFTSSILSAQTEGCIISLGSFPAVFPLLIIVMVKGLLLVVKVLPTLTVALLTKQSSQFLNNGNVCGRPSK